METVANPEPRPEVIIPRGTKRELRLTLNTHGRWVVREWFETRDGLRPGRGGIELSVKEVRAFYEAVETVQPRKPQHSRD